MQSCAIWLVDRTFGHALAPIDETAPRRTKKKGVVGKSAATNPMYAKIELDALEVIMRIERRSGRANAMAEEDLRRAFSRTVEQQRTNPPQTLCIPQSALPLGLTKRWQPLVWVHPAAQSDRR